MKAFILVYNQCLCKTYMLLLYSKHGVGLQNELSISPWPSKITGSDCIHSGFYIFKKYLWT